MDFDAVAAEVSAGQGKLESFASQMRQIYLEGELDLR
jgi:hypothetical protein